VILRAVTLGAALLTALGTTTGHAQQPARAPVRLAFTGDVNLGTVTFDAGIPPNEGRGLLDAAAPALVGDLVIVNYEGVLADSGDARKCLRRAPQRKRLVPVPNCYAFRGPTALAPRLRDAGATHINLANNHALDFEAAGLRSTVHALESAGLTVYGPGPRIAIDTVLAADSSRTIVGLIGFSTYAFAPNLLDSTASIALIAATRPMVDLLVVTFHAGGEGAKAIHLPDGPEFLGREPRGHLRRWAHAAAEAGADLIVGHGPHVLRGIEWHGPTLIAYSLGNFATYRGFNIRGLAGVTGVLQVTAPGDGSSLRAMLLPFRQTRGGMPEPDATAEAVDLVRRLSREDFPRTGATIAADGTIGLPGAEQ